MGIKTIWAVYFSATGTTEKVVTCVAKTVAQVMNTEYKQFCFNLPKDREGALSFGPDDLVVLGVPVYAGRVPNLLLPYLKEKVSGNNTLGVPVCLFGNRNFDDGLMELRNVMWTNGFYPITGGAFVGEHSFSRILGEGRPDEEDMALAVQLGQKTADKIKNLQQLPNEPVTVVGCDPIRPYYVPQDRYGHSINILKVKPKTDPNKCIKCGLCARICPMGAIDPADVFSVPGKCIKCCACVKRCPMGAKYYDDKGYLYHQHELEEIYIRRADSQIFM
ncbi:4Fe-4S dicluster domain-containing protein [Clostridium fermenticellae]|uniref:4Fe-4S dicluster domain-containing protein n=1 Tax=Clostridium fermenticellae TaxID=2068654 RepID=A0A386H6W6_9CLOT|nr:4Fe-4S binding protein [Clostridium fermenticellae]AYD41426.1 4Fe-4S dicluster domain-containing protein [Clostridium fermenticellae]